LRETYCLDVFVNDDGELMIWADDGAWFQYRDPETRKIHTSFMGFCDSLEGLRAFCRDAGIPLREFPSKRPSVAKRYGLSGQRTTGKGRGVLTAG
jgi:hypothetical protein